MILWIFLLITMLKPFYVLAWDPNSVYRPFNTLGLGKTLYSHCEDTDCGVINMPSKLAFRESADFQFLRFGLVLHPDWVTGALGGVIGSALNTRLSGEDFSSLSKGYKTLGGYYFPTLSWKGFAIGLLTSFDHEIDVQESAIKRNSALRVIPVLGFGKGFFDRTFLLGYRAAWMNQLYSAQNNSDTYWGSSGASQGAGFSHLATVSFQFKNIYKPNISAIFKNIGSLSYQKSFLMSWVESKASLLSEEPWSLDLQGNMQFPLGSGTYLFLTMESKDILSMTMDTHKVLSEHLSVGLELKFRSFLAFQVGLAQLLPTVGVNIHSSGHVFSLAWYADFNRANPDQAIHQIAFSYQAKLSSI